MANVEFVIEALSRSGLQSSQAHCYLQRLLAIRDEDYKVIER